MHLSSFPPVETADENGILAIGGDLSVETLKVAYRSGVFPWPIQGFPLPVWFSPDPRGILEYSALHISRSLRRVLHQCRFEVRVNTCFSSVIEQCAHIVRKHEQGTWIRDDMIRAYTALHLAGFAHSVETFSDGVLVGGLYGVFIDNVFSGESMFHTASNASKVALVFLMERLHQFGIHWIDTQMITPVVDGLGGTEISRRRFIYRLRKTQQQTLKNPFGGA